MRVLVAGSTGAIGAPLVRQLVERGHQVTATTRHPDKLDRLRRFGATAVIMDGLDAASVGEAVARAEPEVIIHQMTALAGMPETRADSTAVRDDERVADRGDRNLLAAAAAASGCTAVHRTELHRMAERAPSPARRQRAGRELDPNPLPAQRQTLAAIGISSASCRRRSRGIVLRYGSFYGPGASDEVARWCGSAGSRDRRRRRHLVVPAHRRRRRRDRRGVRSRRARDLQRRRRRAGAASEWLPHFAAPSGRNRRSGSLRGSPGWSRARSS